MRGGELACVRLLLAAFLTLCTWTLGWGQRVHLFPDDQLVFRDMIAHVENNVVRMGATWSGEVAFTLQDDGMWDEVHLHRGFSSSALDIAYTVREGQLVLGDTHFSDGILYTFSEGQIFMGDSTFPMDVAYTLREERPAFPSRSGAPTFGVYKEDSRAWTDRVAVVEGVATPAQLYALLSAAGLL